MLENCDRWIFLKFRDGELTADQLSSRVVERRFGLKYKTLDDLKPYILKQFYDGTGEQKKQILDLIYGDNPDNITRELLPHEINLKCLRSVNLKPPSRAVKPSPCFKTTMRDKSFNHNRTIDGGLKKKPHCNHESTQLKEAIVDEKVKKEKEKTSYDKGSILKK